MGETLLIAGITGFFASFAGVRILPKYLTLPGSVWEKSQRLLLAIVIGLLAYFVFYYYGASFTLHESAVKSAVSVTLVIVGASVMIYLARNDNKK